MEMPGPLKESWNEFDWEQELRRDDARISTYMGELPRYIDLPDEDAVIMKQMQLHPELVTQGSDWQSLPLQGIFDDMAFDDDAPVEDWQKREGADLYMLLSRLARQWAITFAGGLRPEAMPAGMRILCLYGKLMARTADMLDFDPEDYPALRIAICKRVAFNISSIAGELQSLVAMQPGLQLKVEGHVSHLQHARERVLDLMTKYRG